MIQDALLNHALIGGNSNSLHLLDFMGGIIIFHTPNLFFIFVSPFLIKQQSIVVASSVRVWFAQDKNC